MSEEIIGFKYFKDASGEVYAYEADGSQDAYIPAGLMPMTPDEITAHLNPPITAEQIRAERGRRLAGIDRLVANPLRWAEFTEAQKTAFAAYRQALLDVPQQPGFPEDVSWPEMPAV